MDVRSLSTKIAALQFGVIIYVWLLSILQTRDDEKRELWEKTSIEVKICVWLERLMAARVSENCASQTNNHKVLINVFACKLNEEKEKATIILVWLAILSSSFRSRLRRFAFPSDDLAKYAVFFLGEHQTKHETAMKFCFVIIIWEKNILFKNIVSGRYFLTVTMQIKISDQGT